MSNLVTIYQGEDKDLNVFVKEESGKAYDLTGYTEITAVFKGTSGDITLTQTGGDITVNSAEGGDITITISDTNTALLITGTASFELLIDVGAVRRIAQYLKVLSVVARL